MLQTKVVEKIKSRILFSVTFFFENISVYEVMWKKRVEPERPQMTIWPMRISRWVPKSTNTHSQYVILLAFALQQWLNERTSVTLYVHCLSCFVLLVSNVERVVVTNKFGVRLNIFDRNPQTPLSASVY